MERYTGKETTSYALGMSLSIEALKHRPEEVEKVILSSKCRKYPPFEKLQKLCDGHSVPYEEDDRTIEKLSVKENCYAIAVFRKYPMKITGRDHIVLFGFDDHGDLGTILRSVVSFDYHDIVLIGPHPDLYDPKLIRASMGAFFPCGIAFYDDLSSYQKDFPDHRLYPFLSKGKELEDLHPESPYSLVLSAEYGGLDETFREGYCLSHDFYPDIPLSSLSSIAFSHCYHEKRKR